MKKAAAEQLKTVNIEGFNYSFGHWEIDKATTMFAFVMETIAGSLRPAYEKLEAAGIFNEENKDEEVTDVIADAVKEKDLDLKLGVDLIDTTLELFFSKIKPEQYSRKLREICGEGQILCDNKAIAYDAHFRGRLKHLNLVAFHMLRHQFDDFFSGGAASIFQNSLSRARPQTTSGSTPAH